jgi:plasmid stabilization system protein ParE
VTLRILSLAEVDLLDGFRFYERQGGRVGWYFLESLNSDIESLRLYAATHRRVLGYHRMLSKRFPFAIYYDLHKDEIRIWRVLIADAIRASSSSS